MCHRDIIVSTGIPLNLQLMNMYFTLHVVSQEWVSVCKKTPQILQTWDYYFMQRYNL